MQKIRSLTFEDLNDLLPEVEERTQELKNHVEAEFDNGVKEMYRKDLIHVLQLQCDIIQELNRREDEELKKVPLSFVLNRIGVAHVPIKAKDGGWTVMIGPEDENARFCVPEVARVVLPYNEPYNRK